MTRQDSGGGRRDDWNNKFYGIEYLNFFESKSAIKIQIKWFYFLWKQLQIKDLLLHVHVKRIIWNVGDGEFKLWMMLKHFQGFLKFISILKMARQPWLLVLLRRNWLLMFKVKRVKWAQVKIITRSGHCPPIGAEYFAREPIRNRGMSASAPHPQDDGDHYAKLL